MLSLSTLYKIILIQQCHLFEMELKPQLLNSKKKANIYVKIYTLKLFLFNHSVIPHSLLNPCLFSTVITNGNSLALIRIIMHIEIPKHMQKIPPKSKEKFNPHFQT